MGITYVTQHRCNRSPISRNCQTHRGRPMPGLPRERESSFPPQRKNLGLRCKNSLCIKVKGSIKKWGPVPRSAGEESASRGIKRIFL